MTNPLNKENIWIIKELDGKMIGWTTDEDKLFEWFHSPEGCRAEIVCIDSDDFFRLYTVDLYSLPFG